MYRTDTCEWYRPVRRHASTAASTGASGCLFPLVRLALPAGTRKSGLGSRQVPTYAGEYDVKAIRGGDRKSTRLNSSHMSISYAVFCLKKKNNKIYRLY